MQEKLIKNLKKGDKRAFREVFDQHFTPLAAFGYKYVSDKQVAEDMVQEAFISLWETREKFDHSAAIKSFLYTSVRNKCLNHIKHETVKRKHEDSLVHMLESEQDFPRQVIEEETFNQLFVEIRRLPAAAQEIMILALNGMKNPEIAEELGVSVNTVKTQKKIAYAKIKHALGPVPYMLLLMLTAW